MGGTGRGAGGIRLGTLVVLFAAACGAEETAQDGDAIQIGFINSYSGVYQDDLRPITRAVELAIARINDLGGVLGRPLVLVAEDDRSLEEEAVPAVERLLAGGIRLIFVGQTLSEKPVQATTGAGGLYATAFAPPHLASIPNGRGLLQVGVSRAHLALQPLMASVQARNAVFRVLANNAAFAASACGFAGASQLDCDWQAFSGAIEDWEQYDFRPVLQALLDSRTGPWVLFLFGGTAAGAKALVQLADIASDDDLPFVHTGPNLTGRDGYVLSVPPVFLERTYSTFGAPTPAHPTAEPFTTLYRDTYGEPPGYGALTAFEHMTTLALAIAAAGSTDPAQVAAQMRQVTTGGAPLGFLDFAGARDRLAAGEDIDMVGFIHPFDLDPGGWMGTAVTGAWSIVPDGSGGMRWDGRPGDVCSDAELTGTVTCYPYAEFTVP
jgi:ABC-type branched-subunit amino acid transport system substrate-binding protein